MRYARNASTPSAGPLARMLAIAAMTVVVPWPNARAQDAIGGTRARAVTFGLSGGFARGPITDRFGRNGGDEIGYQAVASLEARTPLSPLRLRADALFADWGVDRVGALTANAIIAPPVRWRVVPYLSAGAGGYRGVGAPITLGYSLGGGFRMPVGAHTIVIESRVHAYPDNDYRRLRALGDVPPGVERTRNVWIPVSVGLQF